MTEVADGLEVAILLVLWPDDFRLGVESDPSWGTGPSLKKFWRDRKVSDRVADGLLLLAVPSDGLLLDLASAIPGPVELRRPWMLLDLLERRTARSHLITTGTSMFIECLAAQSIV